MAAATREPWALSALPQLCQEALPGAMLWVAVSPPACLHGPGQASSGDSVRD